MFYLNSQEFQEKLKNKWNSFTNIQKISIMIVLVAFFVFIFYLGRFLLQPNYAPLFTGLDVQEAGAVVENLKTMNVDYKVTNNGTIMVPQEQVYSLRIQLASSGDLPLSGTGFELFDKSKLAQTDFEQQVTYQRALQGELQRSIAAIDAVERARVHLVLPKDSVFIENKIPASASVLLKLKPGSNIHPEQVRGISNLLIGSIEGLEPENIHIIDTKGNVLSDAIQVPADSTNASNVLISQHELREKIERNLENDLRRLLTPLCGPGRSAVMVSAEIDVNKIQTTTREVLPGQILSEQMDKSSGKNVGLGGAAGTTSQMPGSEYPIAGGAEGEYEEESRTRNYELGEEVVVLEQPPGAIKRVFASIIIDESVCEIDKRAVEQIVASAIGYQPERGDRIVVQIMPFNDGWVGAFGPQEEIAADDIFSWWILLIAAGVMIIIAVILYFVLRKSAKQREKQLQLELDRLKQATVSSDKEKEYEESLSMVEVTDAEKRIKDLKKLAEEKPEEVAQTLKLWLQE